MQRGCGPIFFPSIQSLSVAGVAVELWAMRGHGPSACGQPLEGLSIGGGKSTARSQAARQIALTSTPSLALPLPGGGNEAGLMHAVRCHACGAARW